MTSTPIAILDRLLDDQPASAGPEDPGTAVTSHLDHTAAWYASLVGPLVLPDTALARSARSVPEGATVPVLVVNSGGAGGLLSLAGRQVAGLSVTAVESGLRDLDDLAGNAARLAVAAHELDGVEVFVGLPAAPGWVHAVEVIEAAGLSASIGPAAFPASDADAAAELAEQLSVLVEADLPFRVTWPAGRREEEPGDPGLATAALLMAVEALVDGAVAAEAAELLQLRDPARARAGIARWDEAAARRVRRRLRAVAAAVPPTVDGLVRLGLTGPTDGSQATPT